MEKTPCTHSAQDFEMICRECHATKPTIITCAYCERTELSDPLPLPPGWVPVCDICVQLWKSEVQQ